MNESGIDWAGVGDVILNLVLPFLAALLFPYFRRLLAQAEERSKYADLARMTARVVLAAEQQFGAGTERLEYATERVLAYAKERGVPLDDDALRVLIEAAVYSVNQANKGKLPAISP